MKTKLLTLASVLALSFAANASVTYDEEGVGFVGKGDVQSLFGWNNHELQANAEFVQFRMLTPGTQWRCIGLNPRGHEIIQVKGDQAEAMLADVSFDARKNRNGQVTGFLLNGVDYSTPATFTSLGECISPRNWTEYRFYAWGPGNPEGSYEISDSDISGELLLQVSVDGDTWYDMPITD